MFTIITITITSAVIVIATVPCFAFLDFMNFLNLPFSDLFFLFFLAFVSSFLSAVSATALLSAFAVSSEIVFRFLFSSLIYITSLAPASFFQNTNSKKYEQSCHTQEEYDIRCAEQTVFE